MHMNKIQNNYRKVFCTLMDVKKRIECLQTIDGDILPHEYETLCIDAALLTEKAACQMRKILYESASISKNDYLIKAARVHEIHIRYDCDILHISLPCLLPKKRGKLSGQFLFDPLNTALEVFKQTTPFPKFRECTVCISHIYDSSQTGTRYFDYDNLQQKQLLDTIGAHVLVDDNGILCDVYHTSEAGEKDCTEVFVMSKMMFPKWLAEH